MNNAYTQFIDELIGRRNFSNLQPEAQAEMKREAMERLDYFLLGRMIDVLSDEDAEIFISMLKEKKNMEEIQRFAKDHIIDYETFIKGAFQEFAVNYLGQ